MYKLSKDKKYFMSDNERTLKNSIQIINILKASFIKIKYLKLKTQIIIDLKIKYKIVLNKLKK